MGIYKFKNFIPKISPSAWVHEQAYVSGEVEIADDVSIWPQAALRGDVGLIAIGARSNVQDGAVIHCTHASKEYASEGYSTRIGEDVIIGHGAVVHGATIENEVLIGMNATILDGVHIESQVIVAAGSLVPPGKALASGYLYAGNPARQKRALTEKEKQFFKYSAAHYVELAQAHKKTAQKS